MLQNIEKRKGGNRKRKFEESLSKLEEQHKKKREKLESDFKKKKSVFEEKLKKLEEDYEKNRQMQLADEESERGAFLAKIEEKRSKRGVAAPERTVCLEPIVK